MKPMAKILPRKGNKVAEMTFRWNTLYQTTRVAANALAATLVVFCFTTLTIDLAHKRYQPMSRLNELHCYALPHGFAALHGHTGKECMRG